RLEHPPEQVRSQGEEHQERAVLESRPVDAGHGRTLGQTGGECSTAAVPGHVSAPNWSMSEGLLPMRRGQLDHLERAERHSLELVQIVVVPARIRRAGETDESIA